MFCDVTRFGTVHVTSAGFGDRFAMPRWIVMSEGFTRRQILAGAAVAGAGALVACDKPGGDGAVTTTTRMPVVFLPHGGGPWPWIREMYDDNLAKYLAAIPALPKTPPTALLVISAHWEERVPTVMSAEAPPMLYDYYGFPDETYKLQWPAPGSPAIAARVRELLGAARIESATNSERGFDHGTFVPLKLAYPDAQIPTVQLSLQAGLDPAQHLAIGRALAPLRDEGVFIIGSGMSYHNMRGFRDPRASAYATEFDTWLRAAATSEPATRDRDLTAWVKAPAARDAHPREEHLLPLMVVAGAAGADRGVTGYSNAVLGKAVSAFHFG
jgi:aromatic ring-opening dioxygenase catalytic subunit (LigB family)